ncbi:cyclin-like protein [Coleophoma crateriformis]|uniref:Cyclin-like protein n=1 Tax=Coleophoma crateriformis TaxID=565419 RepID=A0A3D8T8F8_9HELO|nr:cyclin-like protein [Coleophoma crateriformis]
MDARPQRPLRALHIQGDENAAPQSKQNLHQRHKSTGTLSTMLQAGGLKAAAKRTAFGDVSNTVKNLISIPDDAASAYKNIQNNEVVKPLAAPEKAAGLLRPAQRPLNTNSNKSTIGAQPAITEQPSDPIPIPAKNQFVEIRKPLPLAPANKRTLSKKGTTIYKDTASETAADSHVASKTDTQVQEITTAPPIHQAVGPRHHKSQPQLKQEQPTLRRTRSRFNHVDSNPTADPIPSEQIYQDAQEEQQTVTDEAYETYLALAADIKETQEPEEEPEKIVPDVVERQDGPASVAPPAVSEPEEYWEEEEEDEIYDEQGYTTAHSYPSRGDNTTGGATTVLFPKITNKAKKELAAAREIVESSRTQDEIDDETWDTSMVAEYGDEIFAYMRELEIKMLPNPHYMDNQAEIQWSMRSVLMDWLIQVHHRFSLLPETLFLCVNYIDRFLSCKVVSLGKLQLVGATAIFVAAKYEEINCPSVGEIVYMVDGGYTVDEILKAERFMLSMLQFELGWPGPMSFLRRISKADDYDLETRTLAKYFLEVTVMDERFVGSPPSYIAAGAHCLSRFMLKKGDWSPAHVYYSGYTWTQLRPLVAMIVECCESPQKHHAAVFEKYSDRRYKRASLFVQAEMNRGYSLPPYQPSRLSLPTPEDVTTDMPFETRESFKRMVQIKG